MSEPEHWVGSCHVAAKTPEARSWRADTNDAITDVVMLARSSDEMFRQMSSLLEARGLHLVWLERVEPLLARFRREGMSQGLAALARATTPYAPLALGEMRPILPEGDIAAALEEADAPPAVHYGETAWDALFARNSAPLWAVIDGVNAREVSERLSGSEAQSACLYTTTDPTTKSMAPWLVRLERDGDILPWLKALPHDRHWGILLQSHATMKELRAHLRRFTMLWTPANEQARVYFRFYDPRVAMDMAQALEPWKLARLMSPVEALLAPLSPLMVLPAFDTPGAPPALDTPVEDCQGRLIEIRLDETQRDEHNGGKSFAISPTEFDRFGALQKRKSDRKMARGFMEAYPARKAEDLLTAVEIATSLGAAQRMTSLKQIRTLAKCVLEFGAAFPSGYAAAERILTDGSKVPWQKRSLLENWIPRGRIRRDMLEQNDVEGETISEWIARNPTVVS